MSPRFPFVMMLMATSLLAGQATKSGQKKALTMKAMSTSINSLTSSPTSISFFATDPDLGPYSGNSSATLVFDLQSGNNSRTWSMTVSAGTSTFSGCTTIPASAVKATCSAVAVTNTGGPTSGTGTCSAAGTLSTTALTIATGNESNGSDKYTITINFLLTDSWAYIAQTSPTCPLTLTYSINAA